MSASQVQAEAKICNKRGLHARASAKLVEAAARYNCRITVCKDGQCVDARSIMGLMMLGAGIGSTIAISAEGEDAPAALKAVVTLVEARFGEEE